MKTNTLILFAFFLLVFVSCNNDDDYETVNVATAITMDVEALRKSVDVLPPQEIRETGKIYVIGNLILVNDAKEGVHLIDNSNPVSPTKIAFLKVLGSNDMEVKGDFLYVDSYMDLVVFDISNLTEIKEVERLKDVFPYYPPYPEEAGVVDYDSYPQDETSIVVGWDIRQERRKIEDDRFLYMNDAAFSENLASPQTGEGGSLARFKIVDDYLYAVDFNNINIFDISNIQSPVAKDPVNAGFGIETIFNRGSHLFLGSTNGMYIFDISVPKTPNFISEFSHATACDPVVVDGDYAYVTLRGGNFCGAIESTLRVIDISDVNNPIQKSSYTLEEPYGLGVRGNNLFVCDGKAGLKVFDKTGAPFVEFVENHEVEKAYDVIPLANSLIMIGEGKLYQYNYEEGKLNLISEFQL
ncbi:LVIVD repeat-containing protein [Galbibacter mesophilus]|uniref:LVIVD repeat-containing protein n=1 Tax=Galbibacter mesophilus TaxID=379069 RepID=UPI00191E9C33|nr:hypothetical protein [Galbibacter mesophilus]MCM5662671.1 hypothetical protein [Galbibacter mesophilus]